MIQNEDPIDRHEEKKLRERDQVKAGKVMVVERKPDAWTRFIEKMDREHYQTHGHWDMD